MNQGLKQEYTINVTRNFAETAFKLHELCNLMYDYWQFQPESEEMKQPTYRLPPRTHRVTKAFRNLMFEECSETVTRMRHAFVWYDPSSTNGPRSPLQAANTLVAAQVASPLLERHKRNLKFFSKLVFKSAIKVGRASLQVDNLGENLKSGSSMVAKGLAMETAKYYVKQGLDQLHGKNKGGKGGTRKKEKAVKKDKKGKKKEKKVDDNDTFKMTNIGDAAPTHFGAQEIVPLSQPYVSFNAIASDLRWLRNETSKQWDHSNIAELEMRRLVDEVDGAIDIVKSSLKGELSPFLFVGNELTTLFKTTKALTEKDGMTLDLMSPMEVRSLYAIKCYKMHKLTLT